MAPLVIILVIASRGKRHHFSPERVIVVLSFRWGTGSLTCHSVSMRSIGGTYA